MGVEPLLDVFPPKVAASSVRRGAPSAGARRAGPKAWFVFMVVARGAGER